MIEVDAAVNEPDRRRIDAVVFQDVIADEAGNGDDPFAPDHDRIIESLQVARKIIGRVEGGHETRPGAPGRTPGAPSRCAAAGVDDIDVEFADQLFQAVHVQPHDQRVLAVQRQGDMAHMPAFQFARHRTAGRRHDRRAAGLGQCGGDIQRAALRATGDQGGQHLKHHGTVVRRVAGGHCRVKLRGTV
jgi:hypothetical protein